MVEEMTVAESEARNAMLRELCEALQWGNFASIQHPIEVWQAALLAVKGLRNTNYYLSHELKDIANRANMVAQANRSAEWQRLPV